MSATLFESIIPTVLPDCVLDAISHMCASIGFDGTNQTSFVNQYNASAPKQAKAPVVVDGRANYQRQQARKTKALQDDWKKPAFAVTKFSALDTYQTLLSEIRSETNKITDKNWEAKTEVIKKHISELSDLCEVDGSDFDESMQSVLDIIHKSAVSNKYYNAYANVYRALYNPFVGAHLHNVWKNHMASFDNIVDVSETDYDAFCNFNNANTYRKNTSELFCEIAQLGVLDGIDICEAADNLLNQVVAKIEHKTKQKEVEEITENFVILLKRLDKTPFMDRITTIAGYKSGEKPGLTSRTRFKYVDYK